MLERVIDGCRKRFCREIGRSNDYRIDKGRKIEVEWEAPKSYRVPVKIYKEN